MMARKLLVVAGAFTVAGTLLAALGAGRTLWSRVSGGPPDAPRSQPDSAQQPVPSTAVIEPEELVRILQSRSGEKPLILQVGFRFLYKSAHIPGAEYIGPASKEEGLRQLRQRVAPLTHSRSIVLYCGCCPWSRCPNVKPAYEALHSMGFTNVKVLRIEENFGTDWVSKSYPTAKGE